MSTPPEPPRTIAPHDAAALARPTLASRALQAHELARHSDPAALESASACSTGGTNKDAQSIDIVGQERARGAIDFAIAMQQPGYHLFVMGPAGSGKRSLARAAIDAHQAQNGVHRSDWAYVHNFDHPHQPIALQLAAGQGARLTSDMHALVDELRSLIPAAFESEEYAAELERLNTELKENAEHGLNQVNEEAQRRDLVMLRTPVGFTFAPRKGDEVMTTPDYEALPLEQRKRLEQAVGDLQEQLVQVLRASMRLRKEHDDKLRTLNRSTTQLAVDHAIDEIKARYADHAAVCQYLEAVRSAVIDGADAFRSHEDGEAAESQAAALARFEVNLVVDAGGIDGATIIEADLPSYQNLVGRIDHVARFGMLMTDFRHIKAGHLHRANGGYLMIDALKLLSQPFAWDALKRALLRSEIRIESLAEMFSMVSTTQLEPQPIPLAVKVVLVGDRTICQLLQAHDPEFAKLFRVVADLGDDLPRAGDTQAALARSLSTQIAARGLLAADAPALAQLIDLGARRCGDATRISADVRHLLDVAVEADHLARAAGDTRLQADHVRSAVAARRYRAARVDERMREAMVRDIVTIATSGAQIGQVNGLAAYDIGGEVFGVPTRITATTRLGDGQVVDIQRETRMGGPVHAKGVLILSSFLAARYSRFQPHAIIGSLVFEQTYGLVEGDSASLAELVALLASVGDIPVRQNLAVTGSVDQFGNVQAVGGVNEKIEGFFDLCAARGLDGSHGVLIPASNVSQLMLRDDVVQAVSDRRFAVHAVCTIDDAAQLLTGRPAGDASVPDHDTVNGRIARRLNEYAQLRRGAPRFTRRKGTRSIKLTLAREDT